MPDVTEWAGPPDIANHDSTPLMRKARALPRFLIFLLKIQDHQHQRFGEMSATQGAGMFWTPGWLQGLLGHVITGR